SRPPSPAFGHPAGHAGGDPASGLAKPPSAWPRALPPNTVPAGRCPGRMGWYDCPGETGDAGPAPLGPGTDEKPRPGPPPNGGDDGNAVVAGWAPGADCAAPGGMGDPPYGRSEPCSASLGSERCGMARPNWAGPPGLAPGCAGRCGGASPIDARPDGEAGGPNVSFPASSGSERRSPETRGDPYTTPPDRGATPLTLPGWAGLPG